MKGKALLLLFLLLAGCSVKGPSQEPVQTQLGVQTATALATSGPEVASELTRRYSDTTTLRCDGVDSRPAFLCSGILLRGTATAAGFDVWDPSPTAERVGGTSFSFVRSDYKMKRLAMNYKKGLIFYPVLKTPSGKLKIEVLCFFPVDGDSDHRSDWGCGGISGYPSTVACAAQGINTPEKWAENYNKHAVPSHNRAGVCSFDVRDSANTLAGPNFVKGMQAGRLVTPRAFDIPNDVKMTTWAKGQAKVLPIEAFFYVIVGNTSGLAEVQRDQRRFKELTGETLPIIKVIMPATLADRVTFAFQAQDQAVN
ncbi:halovibrin HvnA [Pseudomonas sp. RA_105y_Pfl2_P56]|uniref:halovibrin HvnA n=1 Tax=Pseudomonas sp. RA_105y_Pfl2_P56 TaxID=3088701 RepID=UPI0030DCBD56